MQTCKSPGPETSSTLCVSDTFVGKNVTSNVDAILSIHELALRFSSI